MKPILIAGGGVAGLAAACALAARDIPSIVFEKTSKPGRVDRGDILHSATIRLFKKWGVWERLPDFTPLTFDQFAIYNNESEQLFRINLSDEFPNSEGFTALRHPDIERLLEISAKATGLVEVKRSESVQDLVIEGDRTCGLLTNKDRYTGELVVIANGARSQLRDKHFEKPVIFNYPVSFLNCCFKKIEMFRNQGAYVLGNKGTMIFVPLPGEEMRIGLQTPVSRQISASDRIALSQEIVTRFPLFANEKLELHDSHLYRVFQFVANNWITNGAVLLGDAAHSVHPAGGQGMNLAFGDAEALAQSVSRVGTAPYQLDFQRVAEHYQLQRHQAVKRVANKTHRMGMAGCIENRFLIALRESALRFAARSRFIKRKVFDRIMNVR